jgi:hypothetical protein
MTTPEQTTACRICGGDESTDGRPEVIAYALLTQRTCERDNARVEVERLRARIAKLEAVVEAARRCRVDSRSGIGTEAMVYQDTWYALLAALDAEEVSDG